MQNDQTFLLISEFFRKFAPEMKKLYFIFLLILCASMNMHAAPKSHKSVYDLGEIGWHSPKTVNIVVHNKEKHAVVLHDVKTDCGCTTAVWHKGFLIEAGQTTTIAVTYDAELLGTFKKQLRVTLSDGRELKNLDYTIKGRVLATIVDYSKDYACEMGGGIWASDNKLDFDNVQTSDCPSQQIRIVNGTKQNFTPALMHLPSWVKVLCEPETLRPGKEGYISFMVDAKQIKTYGLTQTSVYLQRYVGDKVSKENEIKISLTCVPRIETDEAVLADAPRAEVDSVIELRTTGLKKAKRSRGMVELRNTGAKTLDINRVQTDNLGMRVNVSAASIKPGETAKIEVKGWTEDSAKHGKGGRRIILITNDPRRPVIIIKVV